MASSRMYLYMARRDKTAVKVLAVVQGEPKTTRVNNLADLGLPPNMYEQISQEVESNKLLWEVWLEPADSYSTLKNALVQRGFKSLPLTSKPVVGMRRSDSVNTGTMTDAKKKSMLQKGGN